MTRRVCSSNTSARVSLSKFQVPILLQRLAVLLVGAGVLFLAWTGLAAPPQKASASLLTQADGVLKQMSEMTGLPIKAPLKKQIVSRSDVEKYVRENLHADMTPRDFHIQEAVLQVFGLVSRDFDLEKFLIGFYTEQAAGFYDPRHKTMFIANWTPKEMQSMILAHELTHALQDQNFDLDKFLHAVRSNDDATNARQAVVEGQATAAMMQAMVGGISLGDLPSLEPLMAQVIHQQYEEFPAFSQAPFFFRFQALFPYVEGMGFMQRGLSLGGWKRLNTLFTEPPTATKEIFEPEVYFDKQKLPEMTLPQSPALAHVSNMNVLSENIMGELGYYAVVGQILSEDEAKKVTKDWLADRYILYEGSDKRYVLVARTRWSSPESALAFFRDYHDILTRKYPELSPDKRSGTDLFVGTANNGQIVLLRKGDECRWAEGIPEAQAEAMLKWLKSL